MVPVLSAENDPRVPEPVDLLLTVDVYHHLADPSAFFARLRAAGALKAGGRVAVVDWKKGKLPIGPPDSFKVAPERGKGRQGRAVWGVVVIGNRVRRSLAWGGCIRCWPAPRTRSFDNCSVCSSGRCTRVMILPPLVCNARRHARASDTCSDAREPPLCAVVADMQAAGFAQVDVDECAVVDAMLPFHYHLIFA